MMVNKKSHVISYSDYSKTFKNIISESISSIDNKENLKQYLDLIDYNFVSDDESITFLYRGIPNAKSNIILIDSTNHLRLPKTGNGMYNSWIDGSPDWKTYPKRSKSIITSTNMNTAYVFSGDTYRSYDTTFLILPLRYDINSEILYGICPKGDMWDSFVETLVGEYELPLDYSISSLFDDLGLYFQFLLNKSPQEIKYPSFDVLTNWIEELQTILDNPTMEQQEDIDEILSMNNHHGDVINNILKDSGLLRAINNIMNPNSNGFELENLEYITKHLEGRNSEIWFEGKAIGISVEYIRKEFGKFVFINKMMCVDKILNFIK